MLCDEGKRLKRLRQDAHLTHNEFLHKQHTGRTREHIEQELARLKEEFYARSADLDRHKQTCDICDE
jgi:hypothetical protein